MTEAVQYVWTEIEKSGREINNKNETEEGSVLKEKSDTGLTQQKENIWICPASAMNLFQLFFK